MAKDTERKLDARLEGKFELVGIKPGKILYKGRGYDFRRMDADTAGKLVDDGCQYIQKVDKSAKATSKN